jgi:hypothetical protein
LLSIKIIDRDLISSRALFRCDRDAIKARYDACELWYEEALARLEALGVWEGDADDCLIPPKR